MLQIFYALVGIAAISRSILQPAEERSDSNGCRMRDVMLRSANLVFPGILEVAGFLYPAQRQPEYRQAVVGPRSWR